MLQPNQGSEAAPDRTPLTETARVLVRMSNAHPAPRAPRWPIGLGAFGIAVFCLAILLVGVVGTLVAYEPGQPLSLAAVLHEGASRAPYLLSAGIAVMGATIYADWRNRRELGFRLHDEFQSDSMLASRRYLSARLGAADGSADVEDPRRWFPTGDSLGEEDPDDAAAYQAAHSLYRMMLFAFRVHEYDAEHMLDRRSATALLRLPFSHYEIPLLEFCAALRAERLRLNAEGYAFDARWDAFADGVEGFYRIIGLGGRLPPGHRFWYMPSLNAAAPGEPSGAGA